MTKRTDLRSREWIAVFILAGSFLFLSKNGLQAPQGRWPVVEGSPIEKPVALIVVNVKGAVTHPGLYHFKEGTKMSEVLEAAGIEEDADLSKLDLNQEVKKGQKLTIRKKKVRKQANKKDSAFQKRALSANLSHTSPLQTSSETAASTV